MQNLVQAINKVLVVILLISSVSFLESCFTQEELDSMPPELRNKVLGLEQQNKVLKAVSPNVEAILRGINNTNLFPVIILNNTNLFPVPNGNTFTEGDMAVLVNHPQFKELIHINLSSRQLNLISLQILASHLEKLTKLETLNLQNNQIGFEEINALAPGISSLRNLKRLYLQDNQIGDEGAQFLLRSVSSLLYTNLEYLYLQNNQIEDEEALARIVGQEWEGRTSYTTIPKILTK